MNTNKIQPSNLLVTNELFSSLISILADYFLPPIRSIIKEEIASIKNIPDEKLLTRQETAELLNISLGTLSNWTKSGELTAILKGRRTYYKYSDIVINSKPQKKYRRPVYYTDLSPG